MNFDHMTDAEVEGLLNDAEAELQRRQQVAAIPEQMDALNRQYMTAEGHTDGEQWQQPTGAHDAYPEGWTVVHDGRTWASTVAGNVWTPGVSGWRLEDAEDGTPAEWVRPSGAHDAYAQGDRVTYNGTVYESVHPGANTWSPSEYPPAWEEIT